MLLLTAGGLTAGAWFGGEPAGAVDRASLLTAWLCFSLLLITLGIGPWQARRTGQPLVNNLLRRDLGIWAALTGLAHLGLATAEVMQPAYFIHYLSGPPEAPLPVWTNAIGTASIIGGYVIGLIFLLLLGLSNNRSLHRLGTARWKTLQGAAPFAFILTAAHGAAFQVIEGRTGGWLAGLVVLSIALLVLRYRRSRLRNSNASTHSGSS